MKQEGMKNPDDICRSLCVCAVCKHRRLRAELPLQRSVASALHKCKLRVV